MLEFSTGALVGLVVVPATLALGTLLGSLPSNLIVAALPPVLLLAALPPLAISSSQGLIANWFLPGSASWHPAVWAALAAHVAVMVPAVLLGVSTHNLAAVTVFALVDVTMVSAASTALMMLSAPQEVE
jgi:hypothetical protein